MTANIERDGASLRVALQGGLMATEAMQLRPQLLQALTGDVKGVVFDLTECDLIDSSGIGLLVATHNSLAKAGGQLTLTGVSEQLRALFRAMRLDRRFAIEGR
jgi:anti-anti-sigma factor